MMRARGRAWDPKMAMDVEPLTMVLMALGMWKAGELAGQTLFGLYILIRNIKRVLQHGSIASAQRSELERMLVDAQKQAKLKEGKR